VRSLVAEASARGKAPPVSGLEAKWRDTWAANGTYRFDETRTRSHIYSIDTPPPTVSGDLHPGHCCSYSQTDFIARYQRMRGREVFYPMGWDDNGLNVERRVQIMLGISCDPNLSYDPDFVPQDAERGAPPRPVSRRNFIESCALVTERLESKYHDLWSNLGLSVDWSRTYRTMDDNAILTSQHSFLDLVQRDLAYRSEAPTLWDVEFQTAVAQAELRERELRSEYRRLLFSVADTPGQLVEVDTTRPELLAACVALVAHPEDDRYASLVGRMVVTPVFDVDVPVLAHPLANPDKGTGIAMVCTFGDTTDVTWWRELHLPVRSILGKDGRIQAGPPEWIKNRTGVQAYEHLAGRTAKQARREMVALLSDASGVTSQPQAVEHSVKLWENGSSPLEIVTNHQWFVRLPSKDVLLERGRQLQWWPDYMRVRYENWVNGLIGDWNITRQRYFGVPFPVWYPVDEHGETRLTSPILAEMKQLPVDPSIDVPPGYDETQRNRRNGFIADPDVMDTWATSSLTPRVIGRAVENPDLFHRIYPMNLRPQAHEIIRTWLFYSVVRAEYSDHAVPWRDVAISGFVTDPDRKKLSKSHGNSEDDPDELIKSFGADAVRYWAAGGRPGLDVTFDKNRMKVGRRLATKLLNVARLILSFPDAYPARLKPVDEAMLNVLSELVAEVTGNLEEYDYSKALSAIESFFWFFCDDYVELVKSRAYSQDTSAVHTLRTALDMLLRLFAPFLPFVTEEVWSQWRDGSVHRAPWPIPHRTGTSTGESLALAVELLRAVRGTKSRAHVPLTAPVAVARIVLGPHNLSDFDVIREDLGAAGRIQNFEVTSGESTAVEIQLEGFPSEGKSTGRGLTGVQG
jgi:valyl-tRNA synthetase